MTKSQMPDFKSDALNSDSEDDEDYVPPVDKDSDSEPSDQEDGVQNDAEATASEKIADEEERKRAREVLWSSFQASVTGPSKPPDHGAPHQRMVKIERRYLFAGNEVVEVVDVPEDSPEAKKWPLWKGPNGTTPTGPSSSIATNPPATSAEEHPQSTLPATSTPPPPTITTPTPAPASKTQPKRPGPRKPKTTLAALPGTAKTKKLTTLDKSAMDWKAHLQVEAEAGSSVKDELEANRRGGGYLDKVEFLKRVEDRKEETLDAMKSTKRRRL